VTRKDPIKKVTLKDGSVRYRFSVRVGEKPRIDKATGKPMVDALGRVKMMSDQRVITCVTRKEAEAERARLLNDKNKGTIVQATKKTLSEHLTEWLNGRRTIKESTRGNYRQALIPVHERLGHLKLQEVTKAHVDRLVTDMLANGRRVGTKGQPLSRTTVTLMLTVLAMALDDAVKQGALVRNVARLVDRPGIEPTEMNTWTAEQAAAFLAFTATDRLAVAWLMSLYGLRRGELLGLRWCDIDLTGRLAEERGLAPGTPSLAIRKTRTIVEGQVVEDTPKSAKSQRTLPLDSVMVDGLTALQLRQREEAEVAEGGAYAGPCPDCGEHHVVVDTVGDLVHPESYSDRFEVLVRKAKLPAIRLHDCRHTCGTLMHLRGVPVAVISKWLGHHSPAFTMRVYVHSQNEAMGAAGQTLMSAYAPQQDQVRK
jgi:integrase